MKKIFCLALILVGAIGIFAQERTISKEEFDAVLKHPNRLAAYVWRGKPFRWTMVVETKTDKKVQPDSYYKSSTEFGTQTTSKTKSESKKGDQITNSETIKIRDKIYKRIDNGPWIVEQYEANPSTNTTETNTNSSIFKETDRQVEYKYLGSEKINNKTTNIYVEIMKTKSTDSATNEERQYLQTKKYWISEEGTVLKEDKISEGQNGIGADKYYNRITMVWELDTTIKIEAPVIN